MNPGEFVGVKKTYSIECFDGEAWYRVNRTHPDFPLAVAALQSLVPKPTVHPAVGLRFCGEEEAFEWDTGVDRFRYEDGVIKGWIPIGRGGDGQMREAPMLHCFHAGREYERRQG